MMMKPQRVVNDVDEMGGPARPIRLHQSKSLKYPRNNNYENMIVVVDKDKEMKLRKLKEQQKRTKQAELTTKTVKAIAQHNSFRYFSRHHHHHHSNSHHNSRYDDEDDDDDEDIDPAKFAHPYINLLDDHLLVEIFSYLSTVEKLRLQFVCKRWHRVIWSNENSYKLFRSIEINEVFIYLFIFYT